MKPQRSDLERSELRGPASRSGLRGFTAEVDEGSAIERILRRGRHCYQRRSLVCELLRENPARTIFAPAMRADATASSSYPALAFMCSRAGSMAEPLSATITTDEHLRRVVAQAAADNDVSIQRLRADDDPLPPDRHAELQERLRSDYADDRHRSSYAATSIGNTVRKGTIWNERYGASCSTMSAIGTTAFAT